MSEGNGQTWKWFLAVVPAWNGDWLFQAQGISSVRDLMESKCVTIRRQTKIFTSGSIPGGNLKLICAPYMPFMFTVIEDITEGMLRGDAITSAILLPDDSPLVGETMKNWIPESITPADAGTMKAAIKNFDRLKGGLQGI
jgi:hypothetical protein